MTLMFSAFRLSAMSRRAVVDGAHTRCQSDPSKRIVQLPPPCSKQARTHACGSETHHVCRTGRPPLPSVR